MPSRLQAMLQTKFLTRFRGLLSKRQALLLDFFLAGIQLTLGGAMYSRTLPEYDESFQLDCLLKVQMAPTQSIPIHLARCNEMQ